MHRVLTTVLVALAPGLITCGGSPPRQPVARSPDTVCVQVLRRLRQCTDLYVPALVDARISYDWPPGFAAMAEKEGRENLVIRAFEEWRAASTDEGIDAACTAPSSRAARTAASEGPRCLTATACQPFVDCALEARFRAPT